MAWKKISVPNGIVDLLQHFKPNTDVVAYTLALIELPADLQTDLLVGSDDGVKVCLNGELVHSNHAHRGLQVDQDRVRFKLGKVSTGFCSRLKILVVDRVILFASATQMVS